MGEMEVVTWVEQLSYSEILKKFPDFKEKVRRRKEVSSAMINNFPIIHLYTKAKPPFFTEEEIERHNLSGSKYACRYMYAESLNEYSTTNNNRINWGVIADVGEIDVSDAVDGFKENWVFPCRDVPTRSHPYGKGEGKRLLPKARLLNAVNQNMLDLSGLQADPPKVIDTDVARSAGLLKSTQKMPITVRPLKAGQTYIGSLDNESREPVKLLQVTGNLSHIFSYYQDARQQVADLFPNSSSVYKTSRQSINEIQQRHDDQQKLLAPIRATYTREGLSMHLAYIYKILEKAGQFKDLVLPEDTFGTERGVVREPRFNFDTFMLKSQRQGRVMRLMQSLQYVSPYLSVKPSMVDLFDGDAIDKYVFNANGVGLFLLSDDETSQIRQEGQQQLDQQQQLQQNQTDAQQSSALAGILKAVGGGA